MGAKMDSFLSKCNFRPHWFRLTFAFGGEFNWPVLGLLMCSISFFVPSTARAEDFEPWEVFAWCSIPPNTRNSSTNILAREIIELPFERWVCDDLENIDIPSPQSDELSLTVDEFNDLFTFAVGEDWNDSIERYALDEYVLDKSECITFDAVGSLYLTRPVNPSVIGHPFSRKVYSDAALVELAEPSLFGMISPDVNDILADMEASARQDFDADFWGSLSRLLQSDYSFSEPTEIQNRLYEAFVTSIELQVRAALLNNGQIWQTENYSLGVALICPPVNTSRYWFYLGSENFNSDQISKLTVAALFFVERNIERAASQLVQQIQNRDRMQFFCGDPTEVFRDRLREQGHAVPTLSVGPGGDVFRYVSQSDVEIYCNAWKQEYFEIASRYLSEFFIQNQVDLPLFEYSSPFQ